MLIGRERAEQPSSGRQAVSAPQGKKPVNEGIDTIAAYRHIHRMPRKVADRGGYNEVRAVDGARRVETRNMRKGVGNGKG